MWLDMPWPQYAELSDSVTADLLVVCAGYTGLWTALHAAQRNPDQRIVLVDAERVGWAA
jgi:glycine/D-amino acid oxidase-like deaminating enzyme